MNKRKKTPFIVVIAYSSVITVVIWIIFDVYRALTVKPAPPVAPNILEPITPSLDVDALDRLQNKIYLEDTEIGDTSIVTPTPEATPIEEVGLPPEEEIVATDGGNLEGI